jgi:hypothetical protein
MTTKKMRTKAMKQLMNRRSILLGSCAILIPGLSARPIKGARYRVMRDRNSSEARQGEGKSAAAASSESSDSLTIELMAEERWPIRGLDPVLHIGDVAVDSYQYGNAENTLLRFFCHEGNKLRDGARVFVQYGQDNNSRTDLSEFRWANVQNG